MSVVHPPTWTWTWALDLDLGLGPPQRLLTSALALSSCALQETSSVVSDYDCPCAEVSDGGEDLPGLGPLPDSEYFPDLQEAWKPPAESHNPPAGPEAPSDPRQPADGAGHGYVFDREEPADPTGGLDLDLDLAMDLNGLLETAETLAGAEEDGRRSGVDVHTDVDADSFPILVRSMSTSRRHSWGVPLSPLNLGRRWVPHSPPPPPENSHTQLDPLHLWCVCVCVGQAESGHRSHGQ